MFEGTCDAESETQNTSEVGTLDVELAKLPQDLSHTMSMQNRVADRKTNIAGRNCQSLDIHCLVVIKPKNGCSRYWETLRKLIGNL